MCTPPGRLWNSALIIEEEEDVSADEDHLEFNSGSNDSEPNKETAIHNPPSKRTTFENGKI